VRLDVELDPAARGRRRWRLAASGLWKAGPPVPLDGRRRRLRVCVWRCACLRVTVGFAGVCAGGPGPAGRPVSRCGQMDYSLYEFRVWVIRVPVCATRITQNNFGFHKLVPEIPEQISGTRYYGFGFGFFGFG
jgi:hypothetical protein